MFSKTDFLFKDFFLRALYSSFSNYLLDSSMPCTLLSVGMSEMESIHVLLGLLCGLVEDRDTLVGDLNVRL
jgi:hypothetical protein